MDPYEISREDIERQPRVPGISALIRYYNDRHTLLPCLESIRGVFDEIVVVHQPCDDFSEELLERIAEGGIPSLAGEAIRVFAYPWFVYPPHYPRGSVEPGVLQTLANYCNYGLSKIRTDHFLKIDTDQIYFNRALKEMLEAGVREGVDYAPFGINLFLDACHVPVVNPAGLFNGLGGDTRMMSFARRPFFIHTQRYEVLTAEGLNGRRFPVPMWLHLTQIRRPAQMLTDLRPLEEHSGVAAVAKMLADEEFPQRLNAARTAVAEAHGNSLTFPWVEEFMIVGNGLIDRSAKLGEMIDAHPFVVRFGEGGIADRLEPEKEFVGTKADLFCLNGWLFHPTEHLAGKRVMFTRPLEDRANLGRGLFVAAAKRDHIARATKNLCHIPKRVFYEFFREYAYDNPSSGLIFVYYVRRVLGRRVKLVNFGFAPGLPSFHNGGKTGAMHQTGREREILASIMTESALVLEDVEGVAHLRLPANAESQLAHRLDAPDGSLMEIVADGVWEKLVPGTATRVAMECCRVLKPGGSITVSTADLGAVGRLLDENDEEAQEMVRAYLDRHLPDVAIYAPALMINHWIRTLAFVYDDGLLVETLAEAGFDGFFRNRDRPGLLTVTATRPASDGDNR